METPQISYFPVCIRVELEETQFWSLSQFWELLAENRTAYAYAGKADQELPLAFSLST